MIAAYGGYVLKIHWGCNPRLFVVDSSDFYLPSINAVNCACSMIKVVREGLNPILNQYDYPEPNVRIGIDVGENAVVQYGWETRTIDGKIVSKRPQARYIRLYDEHRDQDDYTRKARSNHNRPISV